MTAENDATRSKLAGTWLQDMGPNAIGAWTLKEDGKFEFSWQQAPEFGKVFMSGFKGRWLLTNDQIPPVLTLQVQRIKSPLKRAIDVVYFGVGGPVNPVAFLVRTAAIGASEIAFGKLANAGYGVTAEVSFAGIDELALQPIGSEQKSSDRIQWSRA
ncbi:hypothetical protein ACH4C6_20480 [Streptomyces sp. NPDC017943]|uniref:hypothetical protein n=1 Tax=Streptomyces sp. NPDC017943 TaxID=3365019 RepID=UPI003799C517